MCCITERVIVLGYLEVQTHFEHTEPQRKSMYDCTNNIYHNDA